MDNLSVGNVVSSWFGRDPHCPSVVQRPFFALWKSFRNDPGLQFRSPAKSDRLESRIGDRHHFGLLTGMTSDPRPPCPRTRI